MSNEVIDLAKHLEYLNMDEDQVLRLAHSFKHLNIHQRRATPLREVHDLVVHISQCRTPRCQYQYCRKVKAYFRHSVLCKTRAAGGCDFCKTMLQILQHYSQACKESNCNKPFCSDLKECRRRAQKQSDSRRGGAEVADSSNFKGTPEQCQTPRCQYPNCGKFRRLTRHGALCKTRAAGGCHLCKEMCRVIEHVSQAFIESCNEPLCRDLKECQRRAQEQSERLGAKLAEIVNFQGTPEQLREILDLVVHISRCPSACCSYLNCSTAKGLFTHSSLCKTRVVGGCLVCQKLWRIIYLHAKNQNAMYHVAGTPAAFGFTTRGCC